MPLNKIVKEKEEESINICEVSPLACKKFAKRPGVEVFIIYLYKVEEQLRYNEKEPTNVLVKLLLNHYIFTDVFNRKTAENLLPYRLYDYKIILEDKLTIGHSLIYNILGYYL